MIKHVLKDGTKIDDVTGYVIRMDEFKSLYKLIDSISRKGNVHETVSASD